MALSQSSPGHDHSHDNGNDHSHDNGHDHDPSGHEHHGHDSESVHDHGGHGEQHGHGHSAKQLSGEGAHSVAVGLVASAMLVPLVIYMALSDGYVAELTMKMLDTFVSIFLAVLWFNTFSQVLDTFALKSAFPFAEELLSFVQVVVLYCIAMAIAWLWRNQRLTMTTVCSVGAHFIAFDGIMASGSAQQTASDVASKKWEPLASFAFCAVVVVVLGLISFANFSLWRNKVHHHEFNHSVEHMELDILGLVLSFLITQAVRHAIAGRYPPLHLLLQKVVESTGHDRYKHQAWQCWFMLAWAVLLTALAGVLLPLLSAKAGDGVWAVRIIHVLKVVLIMLVAWGYLLWGEWQFYEGQFAGDALFGHMVFACGATMVCLLLLYAMALLQGRVKTTAAKQTTDITVTGISLVAAWSWEHCFNNAFDVIGHQYQVGYGGLVPKLVLAITIPAVMLPTYVKHIRTRVLELDEGHSGHSPARSDALGPSSP